MNYVKNTFGFLADDAFRALPLVMKAELYNWACFIGEQSIENYFKQELEVVKPDSEILKDRRRHSIRELIGKIDDKELSKMVEEFSCADFCYDCSRFPGKDNFIPNAKDANIVMETAIKARDRFENTFMIQGDKYHRK